MPGYLVHLCVVLLISSFLVNIQILEPVTISVADYLCLLIYLVLFFVVSLVYYDFFVLRILGPQ